MPGLTAALVSSMIAVASATELVTSQVEPGGSAGLTNELLLPTNSSPYSPPPPPSNSSLLLPPSQPRPSAPYSSPYSSPYSPSNSWVFPSGLPPPLPPIDACGSGPPCGTCEVCQAYADAEDTLTLVGVPSLSLALPW